MSTTDRQGNPEKRLNARLPHRSRIKIKDAAAGRFKTGSTINYSRNGLLIETDALFPPGTEVFLMLDASPFPRDESQEVYRAVVKHCSELENSSFPYACGLELIECLGSALFTPKTEP